MGSVTMDANRAFIYVAAFRYALGRRSYAPSLVADELRRVWRELPASAHELILREIRAEKDLGDKCDADTWLSLAEWAEAQA